MKHQTWKCLVIFAGIAFELEEIGPTFVNLNSCPSLPSIATGGRKKFQCLKILLNNKTGPWFLEVNWSEHPLQHGFVKGRSTITQLLDTVHRITSAIDQGVQTDVAFLDFSKAFDSVSHPHLISKLDQIGIKGPLLQWFTSYLDNRVQRVVRTESNTPLHFQGNTIGTSDCL